MDKITNYSLVSKFDNILNYQLPTSILFVVFYLFGNAIIILSVPAILFSPFLVYVLVKERKSNWLIVFFLFVIFPIIVSLIVGLNEKHLIIVLMTSIGFFYLYCFTIKYAVKNWLKQHNWLIYLEEQKKQKEEYQIIIRNSNNINEII